MEQKWMVTRQSYCPDGREVVEIAYGGRDYSNPDALVPRYPGEMEEYGNPVEAAVAAIAIAELWRADGGECAVVVGCTYGNTLPFDEELTPEDLREWAEKELEALPKCARCGEILPENPYINEDSEYTEERFCSEYCAEESYLDGEECCGKCEAITLRRDLEETYTGFYACPACVDAEIDIPA